jgi:Cell wall binding domain 2 (CWB2)
MWSFFASQDPTFPAMAVLLTNDKVMPQVTANYLNTFPPGEVLPLTAGGQADAAAVSFFGPLPAYLRFVGQNRYETATKIAGSFFTDPQGALLGAGVGLTTGLNFPDALSATGNLALFAEPLLLTQPTVLNPRLLHSSRSMPASTTPSFPPRSWTYSEEPPPSLTV